MATALFLRWRSNCQGITITAQSGSCILRHSRKRNFQFRRRYSREVDKSTGLQCDQTIVLNTFQTSKKYPETLRRIRYLDPDTEKPFVFLSNNFNLPALTIARLYKARWRIELFFKWIKQHLRIKTFYGTSQNAVKTQIWIAVTTYLLVAILKKELGIEQSLYTILQVLSVSLFKNTPIIKAIEGLKCRYKDLLLDKQLLLLEVTLGH